MLKPIRLFLLVIALIFYMCALASQSASAHMLRHHHYRLHSHVRHYHMTTSPLSSYGAYPNIRYFQQNGHTYAKNLDSGDSYLVRW